MIHNFVLLIAHNYTSYSLNIPFSTEKDIKIHKHTFANSWGYNNNIIHYLDGSEYCWRPEILQSENGSKVNMKYITFFFVITIL